MFNHQESKNKLTDLDRNLKDDILRNLVVSTQLSSSLNIH